MEEKASKIQQWFKDNISTLAIIIICLVYVVYGIVTITESGKTIVQIIAEGLISFIMGFLIKSLFNAQGLASGEKSKKFIATKDIYVDVLEKIEPIQHYLASYCDYENDRTLAKKQSKILSLAKIDYEDFKNNKIDYSKLSKKQKKIYNKAIKARIHYINDAILLSDFELSLDAGKDLNVNKKKYLRTSNGKTLIIMLASAFLFGYFSIDPNKGFDYRGMIWSLIQVAYYLGIGALQFFNGYSFITDTYRTTLVRKTTYLTKFSNMMKENPSRFKAEEKTYLKNEESKIEQEATKDLDLITNAKKDKNAVETKLEPLNNEINDININVDKANEKVEEHIKTFEELCNEHKKKME